MTEQSETEVDASEGESSETVLNRRQVFVGAAGALVGGASTVGYFALQRPGERITPTEPDPDGEATLGELHYILENEGAETAHLDVTDFRYFQENDVISVTYTSQSSTITDVPPAQQYVREMGQVIKMFSVYVDQDGAEGESRGRTLEVHVEQPAPDQGDGYEVKREWVEKMNSGEWSTKETLNRVMTTRYLETE